MIKCPNCNKELSDDLKCPKCGDVFDTENINIDDELNRVMETVDQIENYSNDGLNYSVEDLEKIVSGELIASDVFENTKEHKEEITEEEKPPKADTLDVSFSASKKGIKKVEEKDNDKSVNKKLEKTNKKDIKKIQEEEELDKISSDMTKVENKYDKNGKIKKTKKNKKGNKKSSATKKLYDKEESESLRLKQFEKYKSNTNTKKDSIDKQVALFLEEIDNKKDIASTNNLSETYLSLNFTSVDKFASIISDENEKFDTANANKNNTNKKNSNSINILDDEIITESHKVSNIDLHATVDKSNIKKEELNEKLEQETKLNIHNKYLSSRNKMVSSLKVILFAMLCLSGVFFASFIFDWNLFKMNSKIYVPGVIENYDTVVYSEALRNVDIARDVDENFEKYKNGEISISEMNKICINALDEIDDETVMYDKEVYPEAEDYLFKASKVYFYTSYYVNNIKDYLETGDEYYTQLNETTFNNNNVFTDMEEERIDFLKSFGYDEDSIKILDKKAEAAISTY